MPDSLLRTEYAKVKLACGKDCKGVEAGNAILDLITVSLNFLVGQCQAVDLVSKVPRKHYFTYGKDGVIARPANRQFFVDDPATIAKFWKQWLRNRISSENFARLSYTAALAPCLAMEIFDRRASVSSNRSSACGPWA